MRTKLLWVAAAILLGCVVAQTITGNSMDRTFMELSRDQAYGEQALFTAYKYEHINPHSHPASENDTRVEFSWYFQGENGFDSQTMDING